MKLGHAAALIIQGHYPLPKNSIRATSPVEEPLQAIPAPVSGWDRIKQLAKEGTQVVGSVSQVLGTVLKEKASEFKATVTAEHYISIPFTLSLDWNIALHATGLGWASPKFFMSYLEYHWHQLIMTEHILAKYPTLRALLTAKNHEFKHFTFSIVANPTITVLYQLTHTDDKMLTISLPLDPALTAAVNAIETPTLQVLLDLETDQYKNHLFCGFASPQSGIICLDEGIQPWYQALVGNDHAFAIANDPDRIIDALDPSLCELIRHNPMVMRITNLMPDPQHPENFLLEFSIFNPAGKAIEVASPLSMPGHKLQSATALAKLKYSYQFHHKEYTANTLTRGDLNAYFSLTASWKKCQEETVQLNQQMETTISPVIEVLKTIEPHWDAEQPVFCHQELSASLLEFQQILTEIKAIKLVSPKFNEKPYSEVIAGDQFDWSATIEQAKQSNQKRIAAIEFAKKLSKLLQAVAKKGELEQQYQAKLQTLPTLKEKLAEVTAECERYEAKKLSLQNAVLDMAQQIKLWDETQIGPAQKHIEAMQLQLAANRALCAKTSEEIQAKKAQLLHAEHTPAPQLPIPNPFDFHADKNFWDAGIQLQTVCCMFSLSAGAQKTARKLKMIDRTEAAIAKIPDLLNADNFQDQIKATLETLRDKYPLNIKPRMGIRTECRVTQLLVTQFLATTLEALRKSMAMNVEYTHILQADLEKIQILMSLENGINFLIHYECFQFDPKLEAPVLAEYKKQLQFMSELAGQCSRKITGKVATLEGNIESERRRADAIQALKDAIASLESAHGNLNTTVLQNEDSLSASQRSLARLTAERGQLSAQHQHLAQELAQLDPQCIADKGQAELDIAAVFAFGEQVETHKKQMTVLHRNSTAKKFQSPIYVEAADTAVLKTPQCSVIKVGNGSGAK